MIVVQWVITPKTDRYGIHAQVEKVLPDESAPILTLERTNFAKEEVSS